MEELIDVLDDNGYKTGIVKPKSKIKSDGDFHRAIAVCIINDNQEILIQKRSSNKKVYPNLWSIFVKGHVRTGETSLYASQREIYEELGFLVNVNELEYLYTIKEEKVANHHYIENIFFDTFLLKIDIDLKDIIIEKEEVSEVCFKNYQEVLNLIENSNIMIPNTKDYERIFSLLEENFKRKNKAYLK